MSQQSALPSLTPNDAAALVRAHQDLEGQSFAMTVAAKAGMPVDALLRLLPAAAQTQISQVVNRALEQCLHVALNNGLKTSATPASKRLHTLATAATGAAGGFFGLAGLAVELPITTTVMLHSIAEIARREGEQVDTPEGALSCLQVFALGAGDQAREPLESAYYATRGALAQLTREAASWVAEKGVAKEGAPALLAFMSRIAARFGLEVSEKAAAQLVPVVGAAGGLALNVLFTSYFQRLAEGHFTVRRLERAYGPELVQAAYQQIQARNA